MPKLPAVAVVGAPNVGKSTLFNRLVRRRLALVTDEPGVTRDRIYGTVEDAPHPFRLADTGGIRFDGVAFGKEILLQAEAALAESALVLLVVDGRGGITALDREVAAYLRKKGAAVLVAVNKIDVPAHEGWALEAHALGFGEPVAISAEHGRGIGELLETIDRRLGEAGALAAPPPAVGSPEEIRIALVGRPNVGKSSILNRLVGEERMLVSDVPGTTRDAVDTRLERGGRRYVLVDTAGLRRPGRVRETVESLSVLRARRAIDAADVVVLILDGSLPVAAQDTHIAGHAAEAARPILVVVNKWDLVPGREEAAKAWEADVRARFKFLKEVPVLFVSARTGQRVAKIFDRVDRLHAEASLRVPTPELNAWLQEEGRREHRSPAKGGSIRLFYGTQTGVRPPRFLLFCNDARRVHFSLRRRLENSLRERFGFGAAPLRLTFRSRRERAAR